LKSATIEKLELCVKPCAIDISDGISILNWLFAGGPEPAPPRPAPKPCGRDPDPAGSAKDLGCLSYRLLGGSRGELPAGASPQLLRPDPQPLEAVVEGPHGNSELAGHGLEVPLPVGMELDQVLRLQIEQKLVQGSAAQNSG